MSDPVAAITESEATGEVAAIFADIRAVLGVGVVNLIWRHLATIPDALPWAWATVRPLYANGAISAEAAALRGELDLPRLSSFPPEVFQAAGLQDHHLVAIRSVLAAYDRTNAMALTALSALISRLDGESPGRAGSPVDDRPTPEPQVAIPLPKLLDLTEMAPATATLVLTLNRLGAKNDTPILASMYRHLAHSPPYLALSWSLIAPLALDGRLDRSVADTVAKARTRIDRITAQLPSPAIALPAPVAAAAAREALEAFTGDVIARMVVICAVLRNVSGGS